MVLELSAEGGLNIRQIVLSNAKKNAEAYNPLSDYEPPKGTILWTSSNPEHILFMSEIMKPGDKDSSDYLVLTLKVLEQLKEKDPLFLSLVLQRYADLKAISPQTFNKTALPDELLQRVKNEIESGIDDRFFSDTLFNKLFYLKLIRPDILERMNLHNDHNFEMLKTKSEEQRSYKNLYWHFKLKYASMAKVLFPEEYRRSPIVTDDMWPEIKRALQTKKGSLHDVTTMYFSAALLHADTIISDENGIRLVMSQDKTAIAQDKELPIVKAF